MIKHRRVYTDRRGQRVASGYVVATTNHPAAGPHGPAVHQRFDLEGGVLTLALPPNVYLLHAELTDYDGTQWAEQAYLTLEDPE